MRKTLLFLLLSMWVINSASAVELPVHACANKIDCATRSVVSLLPDWPENFTRNEEPEGSGIVLGDGTLIATADHVIGPAKSARIRTWNGVVSSAEIVLRDPLTDIALLKTDSPLTPFPTNSFAAVADEACAIGNAFGLDLSVNCGVISAARVSGVGFNPIEDFLQTDAAVNPGMSGGALVDENGNLVGMLSAIFTRQSDANIGVNFAVSEALLSHVVETFQNNGSVSHRRPGIVVRQNNPALTEGVLGAEIMRVYAQSPEEDAGMEVGDIILWAGGRRIKRIGTYAAAITLSAPNEHIDLVVLRGKKQMNLRLNF
ncbi:MAG: trypsin-like peptidase domain-containing protein [Rhizobiaceae bacterium]|nr:trypsin-like peptidase domain-containing protein [Rhizobiaceae bacterium]